MSFMILIKCVTVHSPSLSASPHLLIITDATVHSSAASASLPADKFHYFSEVIPYQSQLNFNSAMKKTLTQLSFTKTNKRSKKMKLHILNHRYILQ